MIFTRAVFEDGVPMSLCWVTFIFIPMIHGELFVQLQHYFVSIGFSQYRSSRYAQVFAVSFNDGLVWNIMIRLKSIPVNNNKLRNNSEFVQSFVHRLNRSI